MLALTAEAASTPGSREKGSCRVILAVKGESMKAVSNQW